MDFRERQAQFVGYAVYEVYKKVVTVNCHNIYLHRIEEAIVFFEIDGNNIVSPLRCQTDGNLTVATVNSYCTVGILKAYNLVTGGNTRNAGTAACAAC